MSRFNFSEKKQLLPFDGETLYHGRIYSQEESHEYLEKLLTNIDWQYDQVMIFGKKMITKRKVAWYADTVLSYTYSNITKTSIPWTDDLLELKQNVEKLTNAQYNSCLMNLYHNGDEGVTWHSDGEKSLKPLATIASLSFGAERKFSLKHKKTKETVSVSLENGSLLTMEGATQINWLHSLPKTKKVKTPRISLTFRQMLPQMP